MSAESKIVHTEEVTSNVPPQALGRSWMHRLVAFALPSETISFASAVAGPMMFWRLSSGEGPRFFFRMPEPWGPLGFALPAVALCLLIAFIGSRRPGPPAPRYWVLFVTAVNVAIAALVAYAGLVPNLPWWLADPYPLHALSLSAAVSAIVLVPRFLRPHPLNHSVQLIAPVSLAVWLTLAWNGSVIYMNREIADERRTIEGMAAVFDDAALRLREAASVNLTSTELEDDSAGSGESRGEAAIVGLARPSTFPLPDAQRWDAAGVLERTGNMKKDELKRAVTRFVDTAAEAVVRDGVPLPRLGRFRMRRTPSSFEYTGAVDAEFERTAGIGLRYFDAVGKWLPSLASLEVGPVATNVAARRREIDEHIARLQEEATTWWWAALLNAGRDPGVTTESLAMLMRQPFGDTLRPAADAAAWRGLTWRRVPLRAPSPCERLQQLPTNRSTIPAADTDLDEEQLRLQREGLARYLIGEQFDLVGLVRCFAYHAPIDAATDQDDLIVLELRLTYEVQGIKTNPVPRACAVGSCKFRYPGLPGGTLPSSVTLFVDVPPRASLDGFQRDVVSVLHTVYDTAGVTFTEGVEQQPEGRQALTFVLTGGQQ